MCLVINWREGKGEKFGKAEKNEKAEKFEKIEKFEKTGNIGNIGSVTGGDRSCQEEKDCNPVSYTHLDVYKRQMPGSIRSRRIRLGEKLSTALMTDSPSLTIMVSKHRCV